MEPINRYERARRYTKDTVILLVTALSEQYLEKAAEKVREKLCDTKFVRGFTDFVMDTEISYRKTMAKVFFAEGDTEVFQAVSNYKEGKEAILKVVNDTKSLMCFSCPRSFNIGDVLTEPLECFV